MHNVLIIFYIAFSIGNLFILPELFWKSGSLYKAEMLPHDVISAASTASRTAIRAVFEIFRFISASAGFY